MESLLVLLKEQLVRQERRHADQERHHVEQERRHKEQMEALIAAMTTALATRISPRLILRQSYGPITGLRLTHSPGLTLRLRRGKRMFF